MYGSCMGHAWVMYGSCMGPEHLACMLSTTTITIMHHRPLPIMRRPHPADPPAGPWPVCSSAAGCSTCKAAADIVVCVCVGGGGRLAASSSGSPAVADASAPSKGRGQRWDGKPCVPGWPGACAGVRNPTSNTLLASVGGSAEEPLVQALPFAPLPLSQRWCCPRGPPPACVHPAHPSPEPSSGLTARGKPGPPSAAAQPASAARSRCSTRGAAP